METQAEIERKKLEAQNSDMLQRQALLEAFKQKLKVDRQNAVLNGTDMPAPTVPTGIIGSAQAASGATPAAAPTVTVAGATSAPASASGTTGAQTPTPAQIASGDVSAADLPGIAKKYNIPEQALRNDLAFNDGKGIAEMIFKAGRPNMQVVNGVAVDLNATKPGVVPSVTTSSDGRTIYTKPGAAGEPEVVVPRGAADAYGLYRGIDQGAKAATTPIKVYNPATGRYEYTTEAAVIGTPPAAAPAAPTVPAAPAGPAPAASATKIPPAEQAARDADALSVLKTELVKAQRSLATAEAKGDPTEIARMRSDVSGLMREISRQEKKTVAAAPADQRLAAGPSVTEKAAAEATGDLNKAWVKSYETVRDAGAAADDVLTSVGVTRDAIKKLGGTGWGTEAKANAANVLAGLGIATTKAEAYASSAQQFQSAAMARLWTKLNAAKGPQTEGDADRAKATYAQLRSTTQANTFILDLAQANAEWDKMKAAFYEAAIPAAKQSGDLGSIDRAWRERAPSVFSMPSMKHWGVSASK